MWVNLNGRLVKEEKASISINNRSFKFGDGFFETMRLCHGCLPLWDMHVERLLRTVEVLQFEMPAFFSPERLQQQIFELAQKNEHLAQARIRITFFRGDGGLYDPENLTLNWLIQTWPLEELPAQLHQNGLVVGIYKEGFKAADSFAHLKSNNFLLYSQAALFAKHQHWNDALVLNHKGSIADATIANFFIVKNETIITPPLSDGPLAGVMRRYLLEQLSSTGWKILEQSIFPDDLANADAAFLSNAVFGIRWVQSIDDKNLEHGPASNIYRQMILPLFNQFS